MTVIPGASLEQSLRMLLQNHPGAIVGATDENSSPMPWPDAIPLNGQHVRQGAAVESVVTRDVLKLALLFDRAKSEGIASDVVLFKGDPEFGCFANIIDLREKYGVVVGVYVPTDIEARGIAPHLEAGPALAPRFGKQKKDLLAVLLDVDDDFCQMLGYERDELLGLRTLEVTHPDDHELAIEQWLEMLGSPGLARRARLRYLKKDGSPLWVEITNTNLLDDPQHGYVLTDLADISEEMAALEEVREREQLLHRLAEALPTGVLQIDAEQQVVYANERLAGILGAPGATTVTSLLAHVLPDDRRTLEGALASVLAAGEDCDVEVRVDTGPSETGRRCLVSLRALSNAAGITGAVASVSDVTEAAELRVELHRQATVDPLTGALNRAAVMTALDGLLDSQERGAGTAVVFVDLDLFKQVNDRHGHAAGDELLKVVADRLTAATGAQDVVGRLGGDEFLVVCPTVESEEEALAIAGRLEAVLHADVRLEVGTVPLSASVGLAWSDAPRVRADDLVARADAAMYDRKAARTSRLVPLARRLPRRGDVSSAASLV